MFTNNLMYVRTNICRLTIGRTNRRTQRGTQATKKTLLKRDSKVEHKEKAAGIKRKSLAGFYRQNKELRILFPSL